MGTEDSQPESSKRRRVTKTVKLSATQPQQNASTASLDETLDEFANGFTPYRKAATRASRKLSRSKKSNAIPKKDSADSVREKEPASALVSHEEGPSPQSLPASSGDSNVSCSVCGLPVPRAESSQHRLACLKNKFQRKKGQPAKHPYIMCQVCQQDIGALDVEARTRHVNACIDNMKSSAAAGEETLVDVSDKECCAVCHKKLGHLNITRRHQHVNRCMDKLEQDERSRREQEAALEDARNRVLDCPLCGKKLKTHNSRQSHMKKCAQTLSVPLPTLMDRIRQQEEEYRVQLEAGDIPVNNARPRVRSRGRGRNGSTSGTRNNVVQNSTVHRLDEQTQLALALSTSLAEEQQRQRTSLGEAATTPPEPSTSIQAPATDAFSILMSPKKLTEKKRKKKNRPQVTPALLLRTREEMEQRMNARVAELILPQDNDVIHSTPGMKASLISSKYCRKQNGLMKSLALWSSSSLGENAQKEPFYVPELQTHIDVSTVVTGSKLRSVTSIPGRGLDDSLAAVSPKAIYSDDTATGNDTTLLASTQTAVLLAELAAEGGNVTMPLNVTMNATRLGLNKSLKVSDSSSLETSASCLSFRICGGDETLLGSQLGNVPMAEASGFIVQKQESEHSPSYLDQSLGNDLGDMVGNELASDLVVEVRGQRPLPAHKFMLAARCRQLYEEVRHSQTLCLSEYSEEATRAVLTYIYTACGTAMAAPALAECRALGQRCQLSGFYTACEKASSNAVLKAEELNPASSLDQTLHELLRQTWGSDSEDSDVDEGCEDAEDEAAEDAEMEQLYQFMASQKHPQPPEDEDDDEEEDRDPGLNSTHLSEKYIYDLLNGDSDTPSNEDPDRLKCELTAGRCSVNSDSGEKYAVRPEQDKATMRDNPTLNYGKDVDNKVRTSLRMKQGVSHASDVSDAVTRLDSGTKFESGCSKAVSSAAHDGNDEMSCSPEPIDCDEEEEGWETTLDDEAIMAASVESSTEGATGESSEETKSVHGPSSSPLTCKVKRSKPKDPNAKEVSKCKKLENQQENNSSSCSTPASDKMHSQGSHISNNTPDGCSAPSRNATPDLFACSPRDTSSAASTPATADDDSVCSLIEDTPFVKRSHPSQATIAANSRETAGAEDTMTDVVSPTRCLSATLFDSEDSDSGNEIGKEITVNCSEESEDEKEKDPRPVGNAHNVKADVVSLCGTESVLETPESQTMGELLLEVSSSPSDSELPHGKNSEHSASSSPGSPIFTSQKTCVTKYACKNLMVTFSDDNTNNMKTKREIVKKLKNSSKRKISDNEQNIAEIQARSSASSPQKKRHCMHSEERGKSTPAKGDVHLSVAHSPVFAGKSQNNNNALRNSDDESSVPEEIDLTLDDDVEIDFSSPQRAEDQMDALSFEKEKIQNEASDTISDDGDVCVEVRGNTSSANKKQCLPSVSATQKSPQYSQHDAVYEVLDAEEQPTSAREEMAVDAEAGQEDTGHDVVEVEDDAAAFGVWDDFEDAGGFPDDFSMRCSPPMLGEHTSSPQRNSPVPLVHDAELTASPNEDFWKSYETPQKSVTRDSEMSTNLLRKTPTNSPNFKKGKSVTMKTAGSKGTSTPATPNSNPSYAACGRSLSQRGDVIPSPAVQRLKEGNLNVTFDPPTDIETDCSMLCEDSFLFSAENEPTMEDGLKKNKQKHPAADPKPIRPAPQWVPPSPFTPMRTYSSMDTPTLKRECQNLGLRPQPKKRMVKVLEAVYKETHQLETDSEFEQSIATSPVSGPSSACSGRSPVTSKPAAAAKPRGRPPKQKSQPKVTSWKKSTPALENSEKSDSDEASDDSNDDSLCPEESMLELDDDIPMTQASPQKGRTKLTPEQRLQEKRNKILNYITNTKHIRERVLLYEPLEFEDFQDELKSNGINVGVGVIMDLLDEHNVLFSMRKSRQKKVEKKAARRKRRSPQKRSPRKTSPKKKPSKPDSVSSSQSSR